MEAVGPELRGVEAALEQVSHFFVGEELHPAVRVVDDEPLVRPEQLVRDHERANCVVARATAGVADHVGVTLAQPGVLRRIEAGIHAREDCEATGRWKRERALLAEVGGVALVGGQHFLENGHPEPPLSILQSLK